MKKSLYSLALILSAFTFTSCFNEVGADGALSTKFPVAYGKYVQFSKGNLIYNDSAKVWSFTEQQYGTADTTATRYFNYSNATINGKKGNWRCLTSDEWDYLIQNSQHALATVNGVPGLLIAGKGFSFGKLKITWNTAEYGINIISAKEWSSVQNGGVIFLPADGYVNAGGVTGQGGMGVYWSTSSFSSDVVSGQYTLFFSDQSINGTTIFPHWGVPQNELGAYKASIRLVKDVNSTSSATEITNFLGF